MNRKFQPDSYERNDARAKKALAEHLEIEGYVISESRENYSFDLEVTRYHTYQNPPTRTVSFPELYEVEIKNQWGKEWPSVWKEIRIPKRKLKLIERWKKNYLQTPFTFVVLNTTTEQGWFIPAEVVESSQVGKIQNLKIPDAPQGKEDFFHIPVEKAQLKLLKKGVDR